MDNPELMGLVRRLVAWADHMGGWESPVWDEAKALVGTWDATADEDGNPLPADEYADPADWSDRECLEWLEEREEDYPPTVPLTEDGECADMLAATVDEWRDAVRLGQKERKKARARWAIEDAEHRKAVKS